MYGYQNGSEEKLLFLIKAKPRKDPLNIFLFGRDRTGKSALVNTLLERDVIDETPLPSFSNDGQVRFYEETLTNGLRVRIFDTPSIGGLYQSSNEILSQAATMSNGSVDLMLFCLDFRGLLNKGDVVCMREITAAYGNLVWRSSMIVLTFANKFEKSQTSLHDFQSKYCEMKDQIRSQLHQIVGSSDAKAIPVVPVGYKNTILPDIDNWKMQFWTLALERSRNCKLETSGVVLQQQSYLTAIGDFFTRRNLNLRKVLIGVVIAGIGLGVVVLLQCYFAAKANIPRDEHITDDVIRY